MKYATFRYDTFEVENWLKPADLQDLLVVHSERVCMEVNRELEIYDAARSTTRS